MKKEFIERTVIISKPTEYYDRITSVMVAQQEARRKTLYDWLNKTDAPSEVWDALDLNQSVKIA